MLDAHQFTLVVTLRDIREDVVGNLHKVKETNAYGIC
jgi:hypothetical protein